MNLIKVMSVFLIILAGIYIILYPRNVGSYLPLILGICVLVLQYLVLKENKTDLENIIMKIGIIGFIYFLITFMIFCTIIISGRSLKRDADYDAIVVLGAGLRNGEFVSLSLKYRLDKAIELYENKEVPIIVSGGQGPDELFSEASVMKKYLVENGIDEEMIYLEDNSTSTKENFELSKNVLDEIFEDDYKIVFTTNDFHVFRSGKYMEKAGLEGFGIGSKSVPFLFASNYVREYLSVHKYYLIG